MALADYAEEQFGNERTFAPGLDYIPVSGAVITPGDILALSEVVMRGWYTEHKASAAFSRNLSKYTKQDYASLCNSGSSASLLAITACQDLFQSGDYVLTCATGFPTTVAPIYQIGKIPIYVDIDPETLSPSLNGVQRAIDEYRQRMGGMVFAHTLGFPFSEVELWNMKVGKWLVVDGCDALGAELFYEDEWNPVGRLGNATTLSFFPAHQITAGEGGAVLTWDEDLHKVIESYSNWGRDCFCLPGQSNTCGKRFDHEWDSGLPKGWDHKYTFTKVGYNLKMTEFQAALGNSQLGRFNIMLKKRRDNFGYLRALLDPFAEFFIFVDIPQWSKPSPFGFPLIVRDSNVFTANEIIQYLESKKIGTRRFFGGNLIKQPAFANLPYKKIGDLPGSDKVMNDGLWIGIQDALDKSHLDYVTEIFYRFFAERGLR